MTRWSDVFKVAFWFSDLLIFDLLSAKIQRR
jgi:hypothetical protein